MKFRIIATGKEFAESSRVSMLCQQVSTDEFGLQTLGQQFNWEIAKDTLTPEIKAKLNDIRVTKAIIERPFKVEQVERANPNNGEIIKKNIAVII